jgi:hypothetical protein
VAAWYVRTREGPVIHVSEAADGRERTKTLTVQGFFGGAGDRD